MAIRRRVEPTRILCINCNICVNNIRRYSSLALDSRVRAMISSWIYPNIITENDNVICEACRDLAVAAVSGSQQAQTSTRGHSNVCRLCGCSIANRQSDIILRENPTDIQLSIMNIIRSRVAPREILSNDRVCHACWLRVRREGIRTSHHDESRPLEDITNRQEDANQQGPPAPALPAAPTSSLNQRIVLPQYRRAPNSTHHCVFPDCDSTILGNIQDSFRARILHDHNYYIPKHARVCTEHLHCNLWHSLFAAGNSINWFNVQQIEHVFSLVNNLSQTLDFDTINMDETVFQYWVGLSQLYFNALLIEIPRISQLRRGKVALAAFLIKMRTGDSDARLSTLLKIPRRSLELLMDNVREILCQDFVPRYLGIDHISHNELMQHNLLIPNGLFGNLNNGIVICDGTYIYTNKSSNYMFQKNSYSLHKYRNLLKPFMMVASDGYIVDCFGPYKATTSDATIMRNLFRENSALRWYFRENDTFILDRGFRDSISVLEECGYKAHMPESLLPGEHQLTTAQANRNRCITICRWVVEVVNGYFKRDFKLFRQTYFNRSLPQIMKNFQIAAAILNKFGVRLRDRVNATEILNIIRNNINLENNLSNMVESLNMNRRSAHFCSITATNRDIYFPQLEQTDLILISLGTYQIRQARSYYGEHVRFQGRYRIEVCAERHNFSQYHLRGSEDTSLIRCRIKSRHISRKQYYVYVLIENNVPGRAGILEYCCSCLVGRRTVGCCSHVMTVIWYLSWARHQRNITAPADFLDNVAIDDIDE